MLASLMQPAQAASHKKYSVRAQSVNIQRATNTMISATC